MSGIRFAWAEGKRIRARFDAQISTRPRYVTDTAASFRSVYGPIHAWLFWVAFGGKRHCRLVSAGMHCHGVVDHDGPHTFSNREWRRTRRLSPNTRQENDRG